MTTLQLIAHIPKCTLHLQQQQNLRNQVTLQKKGRRSSTSRNRFGCVSKILLGGCMVPCSQGWQYRVLFNRVLFGF